MPCRYASHIELNRDCSQAYQAARNAAREAMTGCLRSRGRHVYALDMKGQLVAGYEAEQVPWTGTRRQFDELVRLFDAGGIAELGIQGGLDCAESPADFMDSDYEPWVADWKVVMCQIGG